jgi:hypothetical protein
MPLQKLQFRPGINREGTTLANEGGWYAGDKVRFRSGQVEKIGGWTLDSGTVQATGTNYIGIGRSLKNWIGLNGYNYLGIGTNQKFYVQQGNGGYMYDVTPIRATSSAGAATFAATAGLSTITVTQTAHNAQTGDWVTFTSAASLGGNVTAAVLNKVGGYQITYISTSQYSITVGVTATSGDTGTGGGSTVATYQITSGNAVYTENVGWGAGSFGGLVTGALTTTLNGSLSSSATTITVNSTTGFPSAGTVLISTELVTYTSTTSTTFTGCTRGASGTTAAAYSSGVSVSNAASYTGWGSPAPAGLGIGSQLRLWSQANYGQNLVFNPRGGPIYYWVVDTNPNNYNVAQVLSKTNTNTQNSVQYWYTDAGATACPTICNFVMVSDASRFVIAFGTDTYGNGTQNPMLISWSDQQNITVWNPQITNQAGNYTLSRGSQIVSAVQTRQEIIVFTDIALYSMQYLGAPYVWGFNILADNISIAGPNVAVAVNNVTYWMGSDKFFMYSGQVQTLPCTLRDYVFQDINKSQSYQFFAGINEGYNEIWWFYCSAASNVIDKYVIYNHLEQTWYYGDMTRTAWADTPLRGFPTALGYAPVTTVTQAVSLTDTTINIASKGNFPTAGVVEIDAERIIYTGSTSTTLTGCSRGAYGTTASVHPIGTVVTDIGIVSSGIIYHENGVDNATANPPVPIDAYVQSSDFDIGDGHNFGFVWRIIPDISFNGSTSSAPKVTFTVFPRQNPGSLYGTSDLPTVTSGKSYVGQSTYDVQQFTEYAFCRVRGRQMSFVVSSTDTGVQWQLGVPRLDITPDGRR